MPAICGIDWASEWHDVRVADTDTGELLIEARFAHDEAGIRALIEALREQRVERAAIERPEGVLVGRLLAAGISVLAIHPNQVKAARERFRPAGGKSDSFDAFVLCELARTDHHRFPRLAPSGAERNFASSSAALFLPQYPWRARKAASRLSPRPRASPGLG